MLNYARLNGLNHRQTFLTVFFTILLLTQAEAQSQAPSNVSSVLESSARQVLGNCQSWPPKFATKPDDRSKGSDSNKLKEKPEIITSLLANSFSLDADATVQKYEGSFLRLLDNIGSFNPNVSDDQLLGIALKADASKLSLWGVDLAIVKHDCMSILGLVGKGGGNYSIPFFSLDAAFQASQNKKTNQVSTFILGTFQSPFNKFYYSGNSSQAIFAGLKAIDWRLRTKNKVSDKYMLTMHVLAVEKDTQATDDTSLVGNLKAGVKIPILELSGGVTRQLNQALQATNTSYVTYFWQPTTSNLPNLDELVRSVNNNLPVFVIEPLQISAGSKLTASADIEGWTEELCNGVWNLTSSNNDFQTGSVNVEHMVTSTGLPGCRIKANFTFKPSANPASQVLNPQLALQHKENSSINFSLSLKVPPTLIGKPSLLYSTVNANWTATRLLNTDRNENLKWVITGFVKAAEDRKISAVEVNPSDFKCVMQDSTTYPFTLLEIQGAAPIPLRKVGSDPNISLNVLLSLNSFPGYDENINQPNKKACSIQGVLTVETTNLAGGGRQIDLVPIQTSQVFFPNELARTVPPAPNNVTAKGGDTQVTLTWVASDTATSYKIFRGTAAGSEGELKEVTSTSYVDTGLTNGITYFYQVVALNVRGSSSKSVEISATPNRP